MKVFMKSVRVGFILFFVLLAAAVPSLQAIDQSGQSVSRSMTFKEKVRQFFRSTGGKITAGVSVATIAALIAAVIYKNRAEKAAAAVSYQQAEPESKLQLEVATRPLEQSFHTREVMSPSTGAAVSKPVPAVVVPNQSREVMSPNTGAAVSTPVPAVVVPEQLNNFYVAVSKCRTKEEYEDLIKSSDITLLRDWLKEEFNLAYNEHYGKANKDRLMDPFMAWVKQNGSVLNTLEAKESNFIKTCMKFSFEDKIYPQIKKMRDVLIMMYDHILNWGRQLFYDNNHKFLHKFLAFVQTFLKNDLDSCIIGEYFQSMTCYTLLLDYYRLDHNNVAAFDFKIDNQSQEIQDRFSALVPKWKEVALRKLKLEYALSAAGQRMSGN